MLYEKILNTLSKEEVRKVIEGLEKMPADLLHRLRQALHASTSSRSYEPYDEYVDRAGYTETAIGSRLIADGKIACVILAGGQGTRLGWHGPKALFPIIPEEGKTILQIHLEKMQKALSVPVAIMCSPLNIGAIESALRQSNYYGLTPDRVEVFMQDLLPLLDRKENWFFEEEGKICQGPDGNGRVFQYLARAGILQRWKAKGIEHIVILPIDNPLSRPLDPALIDFHQRHGFDATTACVLKEDAYEKVGAFAKCDGRPCVLEYSEIDPAHRTARKEDGSLLFSLANINIFVFRTEFASQLAEKEFPWHAAEKSAHCFNPHNGTVETISAWKLETFLFDALPWARKMGALVYPREDIYAPLKNATGDRSPDTVRAAIRACR